jgi:creatinine amidohydrolase
MNVPIEWAKLTWEESAEAVRSHPFAILPLGAVEEHGPHMTLGSDCRAAEELAARLAAESDCILLPVLPYGQVWSLRNFPGSLTIRNETLVATLVDLCESLGSKGFRGVIGVTGHLGNMTAMKTASRKLFDSSGTPLLTLFYPGLDEIAKRVCESKRAHSAILHADEIETSLLMALAPECVDARKAVSEYPAFPPDFELRAMPWDGLSKTGVFGDATCASAEKGRAMLDFVAARAIEVIQAFKKSVPDAS